MCPLQASIITSAIYTDMAAHDSDDEGGWRVVPSKTKVPQQGQMGGAGHNAA